MSAPERVLTSREESALQAYHDEELSGLARWRFERELRASPALRKELQTLGLVGELVRESDPPVGAPDLWDAISRHLPAADAARETEVSEKPAWWKTLLQPIPAAAAATAAVVALALAIALPRGETVTGGVVQFVNSGGRDVVVLEGDADMTVIWVLDGAPETAFRGGSGGTV